MWGAFVVAPQTCSTYIKKLRKLQYRTCPQVRVWAGVQICGHEQVRQSEANMWSWKVRQLCGQEQVRQIRGHEKWGKYVVMNKWGKVRQICGHEKWGKPIHQGCSVRGSVKSSGSQTFTHFNKPLKCRLWAIKSSSNFMPVFRIYRSKIAAQNAGKSLRWPSNVLIYLCTEYIIYYIY